MNTGSQGLRDASLLALKMRGSPEPRNVCSLEQLAKARKQIPHWQLQKG